MRRVVAIDGPAASGKGTLGEELAKILGFAFLDTGLLYRGTARLFLQEGGRVGVKGWEQRAEAAAGALIMPLGEVEALASEEVGEVAAAVAALAGVRGQLLATQRDFAWREGGGGGAVMVGRDVGTVVCRWARAKVYVDAPLAVRVERRVAQLRARGQEVEESGIYRLMAARDAQDLARKQAPLRRARDAWLLQTGDLRIEEALVRLKGWVCGRLGVRLG